MPPAASPRRKPVSGPPMRARAPPEASTVLSAIGLVLRTAPSRLRRAAPSATMPAVRDRRMRMADLEGEESIEIDAPIGRCWEVIADVERAPEWQGTMRTADALEHDEE